MNDLDLYSAGDLVPSTPGGGLPASSPAEFDSPDYWQPAGDEPRGVSAGPTVGGFFGVNTGLSVADEQKILVNPIADIIGDELRSRGVDHQHIYLMVRWFKQNAQRHLKPTLPVFDYDLSGFQFAPEDKVPLIHFLNECDDHNIPGNTVRLALSFYWNKLPKILESWAQQNQPSSAPARNYGLLDELSNAEFEVVARRSEPDRQACENQLRERWGSHYQSNIAAVRRFVSKLPAQDREFFAQAVAHGGQLVANDASVIQSLYEQAVGINAPSADINTEIASIEKVMREDRSRYDRDLVMQQRLRFLYQARDGGN